jgi:hypothetical protein
MNAWKRQRLAYLRSEPMTGQPIYHISDILRERGSDHELVVFHRDAVAWLESQLFDKRGIVL